MAEQGPVPDVVMVLRELEECAQIALSDKAYDVSSDHSSPSRVLSPMELSNVRPTDALFSGSRSCMWVGGVSRSLFWDEEEDYFNVGEENEHMPRAAGAMGGGGGKCRIDAPLQEGEQVLGELKRM